MKLVLCAIRDSAMDAYMRPFAAPSTGMAVRSFQDELRRDDSEMRKHPEDYELFKLGEFDEESGKLYALQEGPESLIRGKDVPL